MEGNLNYAKSVGYGPHLWVDPSTGEIVQTLPLTTPATALGDPRGIGINRMGLFVLQVEVIGRAHLAPMAKPVKNLDKIVAWARSMGVPDRFPAGVPTGLSGNRGVYSKDSPSGHYTHSQIPENSHVDPGKIDAALLFGGASQEEEDMDEYVSGEQAAREAFAKDGQIGEAPEGKGNFYRAGWNGARWASNLPGKPGPRGAPGKDGAPGQPGASHSHPKVSVSGPAVSTP